jgi:hypothetical protein
MTAVRVIRGGKMKEIGIVTLVSVLAIAAAPHARGESTTIFVTQRSTSEFGACFVAAHGGSPASLMIADRGSRREIQIRNASLNGPEARAVKQCI